MILDPKWTSGNELKYLKEVLGNSEAVRKNSFTNRLEQKFKKKFNIKYAIAVNSGASGLHAAMYAVGVKPGDEIITSPYSVLWNAGIAIIMGAKVKFADVKYGTHNINPEKIEKLITKKTKAIISVSYHGLPCDIDEIAKIGKKHKIPTNINGPTHEWVNILSIFSLLVFLSITFIFLKEQFIRI